MDLSDPYDIMEAGKKIRDTKEWAKQAEGELFRYNAIKFSDPDMEEYLKETGDLYLYEALFNKTWGVCMHLGQAENCTQDSQIEGNLHGRNLERLIRHLLGEPEPEAELEEDDEEEVPPVETNGETQEGEKDA